MYDSRYIRTVAAGRYGGVDAEKRKSVKLMKVRGQRAIYCIVSSQIQTSTVAIPRQLEVLPDQLGHEILVCV